MTDKPKPPSFDEIMKATSRPPEPKEAKKPIAPPAEVARRRPSVPTFAEIIGSVELRPEDRAPRPPPRKSRKDERKMPVVVRRPPLGKPEEQSIAATAAPDNVSGTAVSAGPSASDQPRPAMPESSF